MPNLYRVRNGHREAVAVRSEGDEFDDGVVAKQHVFRKRHREPRPEWDSTLEMKADYEATRNGNAVKHFPTRSLDFLVPSPHAWMGRESGKISDIDVAHLPAWSRNLRRARYTENRLVSESMRPNSAEVSRDRSMLDGGAEAESGLSTTSGIEGFRGNERSVTNDTSTSHSRLTRSLAEHPP
jgi:hypothetical protein